ncbi:unnamed protein product [Notodromas monacha]|uniref:Mic1 domain-containing protein n=1 Tax=Notodromas monacha TaxID=399045 RepID=A0A7R9GB42_9CRUS|nr:unnamed protein product [Notodromas monacha]CAG0916125.1 unnamed protein product [Notodromas monacha]
MDDAVLRLSPPITFEGLSPVTSVFYDDVCRQVFAVRSGGAMGIVVKGPEEHFNHTFRMPDQGPILAIKFSLDQTVLAVQHVPDTVVNKERGSVKLMKSHSFPVNWFLYNGKTTTLLTCTGAGGNTLQPFLIRSGSLFKLAKFELDFPPSGKPGALNERDFILAEVYNQNYILVVKHQPRGNSSLGGEIVVFNVNKDSSPTKCHILKVERGGKLAVNIVDNLVVVHHQTTKKSQVFDVGLPGETDGYVVYHDAVLWTDTCLKDGEQMESESNGIYGQNGLIFQPDVIIDAKLGKLWLLEFDVEPVYGLIKSPTNLVNFLLSRKNAKGVVLDAVRRLLQGDCSLLEIGKVFDFVVAIYQAHHHAATLPQVFGKPRELGPSVAAPWRVVIIQKDMCLSVFTPLIRTLSGVQSDKYHRGQSRLSSILVEYARSLHNYHMPVDFFVLELLATTLIRDKAFQLLHQLLQYGTIRDSKQMACLLLSLSNDYPPAEQIALDMLKRLNTANEQILEILLNKGQIFTALRFLRKLGLLQPSNAALDIRKYLDAALASNNKMVFFPVFKFFEQRNLKMYGSPQFKPPEQYEVYVKKYKEMFLEAQDSEVVVINS